MKIIFYSLIYLAGLCYKIIAYALVAGDYCSGTGRGSTRFFRLCNETWLIVPLIMDFLFLAGLAVWFRSRTLDPVFRKVAWGIYLAYILLSPLIWNFPFFLTPAY
jgi:hypothetical protein